MSILKRNHWWLLPILLSGMVYFNSLKGGFVWDNQTLIFNNPLVKTWSGMLSMFAPDYWKTQFTGSSGQYRPLRNITFTLDYSFWHTDPFGYHLTNVALHTAVVFMVSLLARDMFRSDTAGLIAGLLFAVHPAHMESINYVKNRSDLLCTMFFLASFWYWLKNKKPVSLVLCALSMLSKEMGVVLPAVLLSYAVLSYKGQELKEKLIGLIPYFAIFIVFLFWKFIVMSPNTGMSTDDTILSGVEPVRLVLSTVIAYMGLLFVPVNLSIDRSLAILPSILSFNAALFFAVSAAMVYMIWKTEGAKKYYFALLWILLCLGPVSNIIPLKGRAFAEQRLYLPSVGWAFFFGGLIDSWIVQGKNTRIPATGFKLNQALIALTALWVAGWSFMIINRNTLWQNPEKLWGAAVKDNPVNSRAWLNLSVIHMDNGEFDKAEKIYEMLMQYPQSRQTDMIYLNLGVIYQQKGEIDKALEYFTTASAVNPLSFDAWANIGSMYLIKGNNGEARKAYMKAVSLQPGARTAGIYANLGIIELKEKNFRAAEKDFKKAVELNPDLIEARLNLANIYKSFGMNFEAVQQEKEAALRMRTGSNIKVYNPAIKVQ